MDVKGIEYGLVILPRGHLRNPRHRVLQTVTQHLRVTAAAQPITWVLVRAAPKRFFLSRRRTSLAKPYATAACQPRSEHVRRPKVSPVCVPSSRAATGVSARFQCAVLLSRNHVPWWVCDAATTPGSEHT